MMNLLELGLCLAFRPCYWPVRWLLGRLLCIYSGPNPLIVQPTMQALSIILNRIKNDERANESLITLDPSGDLLLIVNQAEDRKISECLR